MVVEIKEDIFSGHDFKGLNYLIQILTYEQRYALFVEYTAVKTTKLYEKLDEDDKKEIEEGYNKIITEGLLPNYSIGQESKGYNEKKIEQYMDRYGQLGTILIDYNLPSIDIVGGEIEEVVEIFSRVNSKGAVISPDWMLSALTYNNEKDFRLGTEIDNLLEELGVYNYKQIKRGLIFQCITNSFGKFYAYQNKVEQLIKEQKGNFIDVARKTINNIKKTVQFLFEELSVVDNRILPYGSQLIFITDFFNHVENPTPLQIDNLKKWFWITTYSGYFTMYSLSKQREAYNKFQIFLKDEKADPVYNDKPELPFEVNDFPNRIHFGSVRAKSLTLFMLNYANNFEKVSFENVEGFHLNYLFYDERDEKGDFPPESAVVVLDTQQAKFPKSRDMSFMLENYKSEYAHDYFLTEEMRQIFIKKEANYKSKILELRKLLIIEAESVFVESLKMRYIIDNLSLF